MSSIPIKTMEEIEIMRIGGGYTARIIDHLSKLARAGITTLELEDEAVRLLSQMGVRGSFLGYEGYKFNLVVCINDEVVHGLPSRRKLEDGDILTIDFGVLYQGWHTDSSTTVPIGSAASDADTNKFLLIGQRSLKNAISQCQVGNRLGDVSYAMQSVVERAGFNIIRAFVGHGVGRELHEDPSVPGYGRAGEGPLLREGMVLAVEVMYTEGGYEVEVLEDGWTVVTADGSRASMFEHTVAVTADGPKVLTELQKPKPLPILQG